MVDTVKCCRPGPKPGPDIRECIKFIEEGIEAQCVGLEDLKRHDTKAGKEHILWGLIKVIEGLLCIERR